MPIIFACSDPASQPFLSVKTNGLLLLAGVTNIGVEAGIGRQFSLDLPLVFSPYTIKNNYRVRVLALQPELRFWLDKFAEGQFVGLTGNVAWFNVSLDKDNRYQNCDGHPLLGIGVSYGYAWKIRPNFSLEFTFGAGYANIHYDVYYNVKNGIKYDSATKNYWGITKAGISLVYIFNKKRGR